MRFQLAVVLFFTLLFSAQSQPAPRILVFSKTAGYRHSSIPTGIEAIRNLGKTAGFEVDTTENADLFYEQNLKRYRAVVFLNTTLNVFDKFQQNQFERYIQAGGGWVGIHAATDTEYDWPWFGRLAGGYFNGHPEEQTARYEVVEGRHPATLDIPGRFGFFDEIYNFKSLNPATTTLLKVDETSYKGGTNGNFHPMSWAHEFDGGRAFYTALGHRESTYFNPIFLKHLAGGIRWAMGDRLPDPSKYASLRTKKMPEKNRFEIETLEENLREPIEFVLLPNKNVLYIEHRGDVRLFDMATQTSRVIHHFDVFDTFKSRDGKLTNSEDGLLGVTLDPDFGRNRFIYFYLSPAGNDPKNSLIRLEMRGDSLLLSTQKTILDVPTQRDECCHTGGSMAWDGAGNLFLSTGDNVSPFFSDGYAPIDNRPGQASRDALGTSGNTNDLRGKILRIHPEPDGSYSIPDGNLFPKNQPKTRPEIFIMGNRNPYRISFDDRTKTLFWGEVGPDAANDSLPFGPRGHDEIGQAREPLFAGWPLFVGDNKPYRERDFFNENKEIQLKKPLSDPAAPKNNSPNNTGLTDLPPAKPAFIWYPYADSKEFPLTLNGGRNAMAGPVFYAADFKNAARPWPDWLDGKLLIYDWIRGWLMAVEMDSTGRFVGMDRLLPDHKFSNPIDMAFSPDGDLFVLEYGKGWFQPNPDARLLRIHFNAGNRPPLVKIQADKTAGGLPLEVRFSADGTEDFDLDPLDFSWKITDAAGKTVEKFSEKNGSFVFKKKGVFQAELSVSDGEGHVSTEKIDIHAGNELPRPTLEITKGNTTFFFEKQPIEYRAAVVDREDGSLANGKIVAENVPVQARFLKNGPENGSQKLVGKKLIDDSDCRSCHLPDRKSVGPSWGQVALKYASNFEAGSILARKIIGGGAGIWGETPMAAHPEISQADARRMADYILDFAEKAAAPVLPVSGSWSLPNADGSSKNSVVELRASYADRGADGLPSLKGEAVFLWRNPRFAAISADVLEKTSVKTFSEPPAEFLMGNENGSFFQLKNVDLTDIGAIGFEAAAGKNGELKSSGGWLEIHLDRPDGPLIGRSLPVFQKEMPSDNAGLISKLNRFDVLIDSVAGRRDLFFVFKKGVSQVGDLLTERFGSETLTSGPVFAVGDVVFQHRNLLADGTSIQILLKNLESALTTADAEKIAPFVADDFQDLGKMQSAFLKKEAVRFSISEIELAGEWAWASGFVGEKEPFLAVFRRVKKGDWRLARVLVK